MPEQGIENEIPPAFTLYNTLQNSKKVVNRTAWSPDGKMFAAALRDDFVQIWDNDTESIKYSLQGNFNYSIAWSPSGKMLVSGGIFSLFLWNMETGKLITKLRTPAKANKSVAWSSDGTILATGSDDGVIRLWDITSEKVLLLLNLHGHDGGINSIAWSPDGQTLVSGSDDSKICLWDIKKEEFICTFTEHSDAINSVIWSPDGRTLASASNDKTIRIWNFKERRLTTIIEGHTDSVVCIAFSYDGRLLASKSLDETVRIWRSDTGEMIGIINEPTLSYGWYAGLTFHPKIPRLATLGELDTVIRIWDIDTNAIFDDVTDTPNIQYRNAKVILVGEGGVGKTSLSLVLTNHAYVAPEATHSREVHPFASEEVEIAKGLKETREMLLWDLAGQTHYRLIHQIHLNEVALALIIFDAHSDSDPYEEINYWYRILKIVQHMRGNSAFLMKKFLVASRIDRGGRTIRQNRIDKLIRDLKIDGYFETSAREDIGVRELGAAIKSTIDWNILPKVNSTTIFHTIKNFIAKLREQEWQLSPLDNLYRTFLISQPEIVDNEEFLTQFKISLDQIESQGLIKKLDFGSFILLKPELLDYYASALISAVISDENNDGLGYILEEKVQNCDFYIPSKNRIRDKKLEEILLIAMIAHLQRYEIVLREYVEDVYDIFIKPKSDLPHDKKSGSYLIFPSLLTNEFSDIVYIGRKAITYRFEGPVPNIYAMLVVRLSLSNPFKIQQAGKNTITFTYSYPDIKKEIKSVTCGIFLQNIGEGIGEITLSFDKDVDKEVRSLFEQYVYAYLQSHTLPESIKRESIFTCFKCEETFPTETVKHRRERGFRTITCGVCDSIVSIEEDSEKNLRAEKTEFPDINNAANKRRDHEVRITALRGIDQAKRMREEYDVYLCYNYNDQAGVKKIAQQLMAKGVSPWIAERDLRPGIPWQRQLEQQIKNIPSAAVFIGKAGIGPWQEREIDALLRTFVNRGCPVIPVLLLDASHEPELPPFLEGMAWVDFRKVQKEFYLPLDNTPRGIGWMPNDPSERYLPLDNTPPSKFYPAPENLPLEQDIEDQDEPINLLIWGITGKRVTADDYKNI